MSDIYQILVFLLDDDYSSVAFKFYFTPLKLIRNIHDRMYFVI